LSKRISQLLKSRSQLRRNQRLIKKQLSLKWKPRNYKFHLTTNQMPNLVQRRQNKSHKKRKYRKRQLRLLNLKLNQRLKQQKIINLKRRSQL